MEFSQRVTFENYTFPALPELIYEKASNGQGGEVLFIDDSDGQFLITLESGMPCIDLRMKERFPQEYVCEEFCLEHLKIHLCYPILDTCHRSPMGYFHVEIMDQEKQIHILPGQMRVNASVNYGEALHTIPVLRTLLNGVRLSAGNGQEYQPSVDDTGKRGASVC